MALDLGFISLADIAQSGGGGRPIEIPLVEIIEDPNQPRTVFDDSELRQLADSIARVGVIQAISVRPKNADGKHVILFGARRYRASQLAGRERIRAVVEALDTPDAYLQLVENIQRDDLKPMEIAAFVTGRLQAGDRPSAVAERLGKPKEWVSRYAAVAKMPVFLQEKLAASPIRAVYELFQAWREHPEDVESLARTHAAFTDAQARALALGLRSRAADTGVLTPSKAVDRSAVSKEHGAGKATAALSPAGTTVVPSRDPTPSRDRPSPTISDERTLRAAIAALEREAESHSSPIAKLLLTHYATLSANLETELANSHELLLSRKAALRLIRLAADSA